MSDDLHLDAVTVPDVIPLFPLPDTVLLPAEVLPLHVFEPRYREMVRTALAGHRIIGMVRLLPDRRRGGERPTVARFGCAGVIARHVELADGRFLIWLVGVEKFAIVEEVDAPTPYRQARILHHPAATPEADHARLQPLREDLLAQIPTFLHEEEGTVEGVIDELSRSEDAQLVAVTAQVLGLSGARKQKLLEAGTTLDAFLLLYEDLYRTKRRHPELGDEPGVLN